MLLIIIIVIMILFSLLSLYKGKINEYSRYVLCGI